MLTAGNRLVRTAMPAILPPPFDRVRDWIFDLDNCLYPASTGLFALIDERMGAYIQQLLCCGPKEARRVQKTHFHAHGTTLAGLMAEHEIDPHHFLADVHDITLDRVAPDERLVRGLGRLPGRKFVFTNGDAPYARRVLERIGVHDQFEHLHDIHASELRPKPDPHGYRLLCDNFGIDPAHACLIEDMAQNLRPAKALGMVTVWVDNGSERGNHDADPGHIDLTIADVGEWLDDLLGEDD
ncbi:MAG: Pyridoxal-5'-phosphate phosphatase, Alphaproteobacterial type [uncultured Sphingomonas sp.]|uniref:Pyridoxal-5'-phosphate phosphatase, Alphaproteobacterial type n=1 Tax=uncultured Sphingomonas sp. TaxID=158754 RepID=A0A6J4SR56_9SPHN|nr:MAG: Pyridoxal-5'-phosphate phosphatase, Alphaproteobacterial type [uncultured Sphingomonas sp.]